MGPLSRTLSQVLQFSVDRGHLTQSGVDFGKISKKTHFSRNWKNGFLWISQLACPFFMVQAVSWGWSTPSWGVFSALKCKKAWVDDLPPKTCFFQVFDAIWQDTIFFSAKPKLTLFYVHGLVKTAISHISGHFCAFLTQLFCIRLNFWEGLSSLNCKEITGPKTKQFWKVWFYTYFLERTTLGCQSP